MKLCLDIGNTHIFGGAFEGDTLKLRFRYPTQTLCTADQFGLFLKGVLSENNCDPNAIKAIAIASVVPALGYSINAACLKYFNITPTNLQPGLKTGIALKVKHPQEVGADRIANAISGVNLFPNQNIIIIDFGTANTFCAISKNKAYLGGAIMPGIKLSMNALHERTAKLAPVDIITPDQALGKSTTENIQSGLYFGQLGAIKELLSCIQREAFNNEDTVTIATGGYVHLFEKANLFTCWEPDLVLHGLRLLLAKNESLIS